MSRRTASAHLWSRSHNSISLSRGRIARLYVLGALDEEVAGLVISSLGGRMEEWGVMSVMWIRLNALNNSPSEGPLSSEVAACLRPKLLLIVTLGVLARNDGHDHAPRLVAGPEQLAPLGMLVA